MKTTKYESFLIVGNRLPWLSSYMVALIVVNAVVQCVLLLPSNTDTETELFFAAFNIVTNVLLVPIYTVLMKTMFFNFRDDESFKDVSCVHPRLSIDSLLAEGLIKLTVIKAIKNEGGFYVTYNLSGPYLNQIERVLTDDGFMALQYKDGTGKIRVDISDAWNYSDLQLDDSSGDEWKKQK